LIFCLTFFDGNKRGIQKELAESTENFVLCGVIHGSLAFTTENFDSSCCYVRWLFLEGA
jgi:hypothetical protein